MRRSAGTQLQDVEIIQALLDVRERPAYLHVGVSDLDEFLAVRASRKVAVDTRPESDAETAKGADPGAVIHRMRSDAYFAGVAIGGEGFDVIRLGGARRFDDALRDFCNAIEYLKPGGAIVIDHIRPQTYAASRPPPPGKQAKKQRNGDVYRLVFFISTYFQGWSLATAGLKGKQLVVWRQTRNRVKERAVAKIARLPFEATKRKRSYNPRQLEEILADVKRSQ